MQGHATLIAPLSELTKTKVPFDFETNEAGRSAFCGLKKLLCSAPVLNLPEPAKLVCDASGLGCIAVLLQEERPVAFYSSKYLLRYPVGEQELLAVVKALEKFYCYIQGADFVLVTDHKPNAFLATKKPEQFTKRQVKGQQTLSKFGNLK